MNATNIWMNGILKTGALNIGLKHLSLYSMWKNMSRVYLLIYSIVDSDRVWTSDRNNRDYCNLNLDWCRTFDTEILCKALPGYQYHSGTDFAGMYMEYAESVIIPACRYVSNTRIFGNSMSAVKKRQINNWKALKLRDSVRRSITLNLLESLFNCFWQ